MTRATLWLVVLLMGLAGFGAASAGNGSSEIRPLGVNLTHYDYPYPVSYFAMTTPRQTVRMAYMEVPPDDGATSGILRYRRR